MTSGKCSTVSRRYLINCSFCGFQYGDQAVFSYDCMSSLFNSMENNANKQAWAALEVDKFLAVVSNNKIKLHYSISEFQTYVLLYCS
jgi:hypothetical protein